MNRFYLFLMPLLCFSCSNYTPEIEAVLKQAGSNRKELEKVLTHYSNTPADSLKLRAAEFLILNMPGKYSVYYDAPWNDVAAVCMRWSSSPDKQRVLDTYKLGKQVIQYDLQHITADYLINNIELSFKVWRERPWGRHIPFDVFCEEILPYRLDTEPLENWREKVLASFAGMEHRFEKPGVTAVNACAEVNSALPKFQLDKDFPAMNFSQSMASTRGTCDHMAALAVFSMRALGIPVTLDFTPKFPSRPVGHCWNSVRDSAGNYICFMGTETNPGAYKLLEPAKVYRRTYALQPHAKIKGRNILPRWQLTRDAIDVTAQYLDVSDVSVPLRYRSAASADPVYLAYKTDEIWEPETVATVDKQVARFTSVRRNTIYLPIDGAQQPVGDAFWLDKDGNKIDFLSEFQNTQDTVLTVHGIAPSHSSQLTSQLLRYGVFEGANRVDFSDAKTLYIINNIPEPCYNQIILSKPANYRYFRYRSTNGSHFYLSELGFYNQKNEKLTGTGIGTPSWVTLAHEKVFDNNIVTFFEAPDETGSWVGIDLHKQQSVCKIKYLPFTEGYSIYEGHTYELYYWTKDGWQSLGVQTATTGTLQYRAPKQALFYLVNKTLDKNGSAFFIAPDNTIQWQ